MPDLVWLQKLASAAEKPHFRSSHRRCSIKNMFLKMSQNLDWFLYDNGLRHERVNQILVRFCWSTIPQKQFIIIIEMQLS